MMTRTLAGRFTILTVATIALSMVVSWFAVSRDIRHEIDRITTADLARSAHVLMNAMGRDEGIASEYSATRREELVRWAELLGVRVSIIAPNGSVRADSVVRNEHLGELDSHLGRPEVRDALQNGYGIDRRYSETTREPYLYYALRVQEPASGEVSCVIRCSYPLSRFYVIVSSVRVRLLASLFTAGLVALAAGIVGVRRVTRPIRELTEAARANRGVGRVLYPRGGTVEIEELSSSMRESSDLQAQTMRELENERNQLETVVKSAPCGLMLVNSRGLIGCVNEVFAPLLREEPASAVGVRFDGMLRVHELVALIGRAGLGGAQEALFTFRYRGAERFYSARAIPAGADEVLVVLDDITERHRMEVSRKSFVADAGHEFQTPLASISLAAELLSDMEDSTAAEREPYLAEIRRQRERMTRLVDDLLLLSRLESGVPLSENESFDLAQVVAEEVEDTRRNLVSANIFWTMDVSEAACGAYGISGRKSEIRRSISNLLDNAVKYTCKRYGNSPGGQISVRVSREGTDYAVRVSDNGVGIPAGEMHRIFGRFVRVEDDRARSGNRSGGYGLGLAIVRTSVESHGGSVSVESSPERTTFMVRLPAQ